MGFWIRRLIFVFVAGFGWLFTIPINELKRDRVVGESICPNCKCKSNKILARERRCYGAAKLIAFTRQAGLICDNCGMYRTFSKKEYSDILEKTKMGISVDFFDEER